MQKLSLAVFLVCIVLAGASRVLAQESRQPLGLGGYCPVCLHKMKKWVKGSSEHEVVFDGRRYLFPGEEPLQAFQRSPGQFAPVLGGDCVVCYAKMSKRVPGSLKYGVYHKGRVYLFPGEEQKKMFLDDPQAYQNADLAFGGNCAVCLVEMKKEMPGKPEISVIHQGLRYLFPGEKQAQMFRADPEKYKLTAERAASTSARQATASQTQLVYVEGQSGCAACEYGVQPIGANHELGLAIKANDGTIYVVQDAHKLYPQIYEQRFDKLSLKLTGEVLRRDRNFVWVKPGKVTRLN